MRSLGFLCCAAAAIALIPAVSSAQPSYNLTNVTAGSPYNQTAANSINSVGHITGFGVVPATGEIHAFIDRNGVFQDLGLLGYTASDGISINNTDELAVDGIGPGSTALFYAHGNAQQIGNIDGGYTSCYSMNNSGDIVGSGWNGDGAIVGFSYVGGVFTDLSPHNVYRATSINDTDQFAGTSEYAWNYGGYTHIAYHAFLQSGGVYTDLGCLTGNPRTNTEAFGINGSGQVVGYSQAADNLEHAFLYTGGQMQDLGTLYGDEAIGVAINNNGLIVGNLMNPYNVNMGAFVYWNGTMYDLSNLIVNGGAGWTQLAVTGLNDGGSIVGTGTFNGGSQGFVLVPTNPAGVGTLADLHTTTLGAWPNPFHPTTQITFHVSERGAAGNTRLDIFDPLGRRIATLLDGRMAPGEHSVTWSGRADGGDPIQSGAYIAHLTTLDGSASQKLMLLK